MIAIAMTITTTIMKRITIMIMMIWVMTSVLFARWSMWTAAALQPGERCCRQG